jgi:hypothetical protein
MTTQMEPWGFIKSLALYHKIHMELSLNMSFYLRCSLGGYMVGTTAGFPVEIVEALARNFTTKSHRCAHSTI